MRAKNPRLCPQLFLIGLFLLLLPLSAFPQGEFLHKGTSGVGIEAGYNYGKKMINETQVDFSGPGVVVGFSIKGVFDLQGGTYSHTIPAGEYAPGTDEDLGNNVFGRLVIHAPKQSDRVPLSVRGILSYGYTEYDEANTSESTISVGLGTDRRMYLADNISVITTFDLIYSRSQFKPTGDTGEEIAADEVSAVVSCPIAINLIRNHLLYLTPLVSYGMKDSGAFVRISLGYMMPLYIRQD